MSKTGCVSGLEEGLSSNELCESVCVRVLFRDKLRVGEENAGSVEDGEGEKHPVLYTDGWTE